jgi:hypothetical protein
MIMIAALATALAASAPATAGPGGGDGKVGGGGGAHMGGGGGGAKMGGGGGGRSFGSPGMKSGSVAVNPGVGRSAGVAANARSNFSGSNFAANRSGTWQGRHHHHHRYGGFGAGFAAGALIGSAPYYYGGAYPYGYYDDGDYAYGDDGYETYGSASVGGADDQYCAQRFKSYDPSSGTYLGYDGARHPCP